MSHPAGTYLGSVRDMDSLRGRCVLDDATGCWHLRSSRGRPMPRDKRHALWVHGLGCMSAPRAAWMLHIGEPVPDGLVVSRTCHSYDCVNPEHLKCWPKAAEGAFMRKHGRTAATASKVLANRQIGLKRSKVSREMRMWIAQCGQSSHAIAHALGISQSYAHALRHKAAHQLLGGMP